MASDYSGARRPGMRRSAYAVVSGRRLGGESAISPIKVEGASGIEESMRNLLAFVFLSCAVACVHAARREGSCTLPGDAPWRRYVSAHFVIDASGPEREGSRLVGSFEELHAAVLAALVSEPVEIPGRVHVVVLPARGDLVDTMGNPDIAGVFWVSQLGEPTILIDADEIGDMPQIVAHELAHYLSHYLFPRQPFWFAEGLAQFVEGIAKVDRDGKRWAGADPASGWIAGSVQLVPVSMLIADEVYSGFGDPHLTSWILYRFLWNERSKQLSRYQALLSDGVAPKEAWISAFPEWNPKKGTIGSLDNLVVRHQRFGRGLRWEVQVPEVDRRHTSSSSPLADLHMILIEQKVNAVNHLLHVSRKRQAAQEALRHDAGNGVAAAELARASDAPVLPALEAAGALRPGDGRTWFLLAREEKDDAAREAALRRAVAAWPDGALAHAALARQLAATGRAHEALGFANKAVDLAPWSPEAVASLARVAL